MRTLILGGNVANINEAVLLVVTVLLFMMGCIRGYTNKQLIQPN